MKLNDLSFYLVASVFVLGSCGGSATEEIVMSADSTDQESALAPVEVTWAQLEADSVQAETQIIFEGYIGDIGTMIDQSNGRITVPIYERRHQKGGFELNLYIPIGNGKNQMKELPAEFLPTDVQIYADDNSVLTIGSRIRVTATKSETYSPGYISAEVLKMESLSSDFDSAVFADAVMLTSEMIADTAIQNSYCFIDGKLDIPTLVFSYTNDILLDIVNSSVKDITTVSVRLGDGPSSMNDLPDNYTSSDLIIRDYLGSVIKYKSNLRLYGVWERYTFETSTPGTFYLEEIEVKK